MLSESNGARKAATFDGRELCEGAAGGDPEDNHMGRESLMKALEGHTERESIERRRTQNQ